MRLDEIIQQHTEKLSPQLQAEVFDFVLFLEQKQVNKPILADQRHEHNTTDIIKKTAGILSSQNIDPLKWQREIRGGGAVHSNYLPQEGQLSEIIKALEGLTNFDDILTLSSQYIFSEKQILVSRLSALIELYDEDTDISIESLKSMLVFFASINIDFNTPIMTLNENGTFQINWKKSNSNLITLRFKSENFVDYAIFRPSQHTNKAIILNGSMNLFDCIEYIKDLNCVDLLAA